jgi:hypothetical protein
LQRVAKGGTPLPLFFTKSNKHAGENEHVCKKRAQILDVKELTTVGRDASSFHNIRVTSNLASTTGGGGRFSKNAKIVRCAAKR